MIALGYNSFGEVFNMGLGKRLKDILKKKNITVQRLSEMTGISANTLYTIIKRDNKSMQAENLINIARVLNVSIDELLGETMYIDTVAPVRHGKWKDIFEYSIYCSDLKSTIELTEQKCNICRVVTTFKGAKLYLPDGYCPNCGARMDGEESNDGTILQNDRNRL